MLRLFENRASAAGAYPIIEFQRVSISHPRDEIANASELVVFIR
jgi:hypothetical protein